MLIPRPRTAVEHTLRHRPPRLGGVVVRGDAAPLQDSLRRILCPVAGAPDTDT